MENTIQSEDIKRKAVATSVLLYKGKILILKRSNKVGTYQGKWACVSGYIEDNETPLECALKEINEELNLCDEDVELIRKGEVLFASDKNILWAIHPFLFRAKIQDITLDWEHEEYKWIPLEAIERYSTVPELRKTIESVVREEDLEYEL
jgi:8-oxo-dGTP pyrophosphatase MutT (NUDIX family)